MITNVMGGGWNYSRKGGGDNHGQECSQRVFREGLTEKMTPDQRPKEKREGARWATRGRAVWEEATISVKALAQEWVWMI